MNDLFGFFMALITLSLGTVGIFWLFRQREESLPRTPEIPAVLPTQPPPEPINWKELSRVQNREEVPAPGGSYTLVNVPLVIVGVLLLVVAFVSLLSTVSVPVAVVVTTFLTIVAIVVAVLFAKARQAEWEHREWTEVPAGSNVTPPVPPQIVEIQTTSQPPPVPAPHPAPHPVPHPAPHPEPQAEWTEECSAALEALIALRIPKKRSIDLVRRAAGSTRDEILRAALRIHGQSRTQPITGNVNGHANGANTPTQVAPASQSMQQQSQREGAIAALISLGIPNQTATALIQQMPATPQKNYFEMRFEFCASVNNSDE